MLRKNYRDLGAYTGAVVLSLAILVWAMQLWEADLSIPFVYGGDAFALGMQIKGMIDNQGWYLTNNYVGMPTGLQMHDFPSADNFHFLLLKLISLIFPHYAVTMNLYFLLTFPLTTISALFVFRQFKLSYPVSILGSLLFAFIPYHFYRGESHLFLGAYYVIPLMVMVILQVFLEKPFLLNRDEHTGKTKLALGNSPAILAMLICLLTASTGIYYAFFACFFLLIAGGSAAISTKNRLSFWTALILAAVISLGVLANITPSIIYKATHWKNAEITLRNPMEAEVFGMKIAQLLLPVTGHRVTPWEEEKAEYNSKAPLINENDGAALGIIGTIGFLVLIGLLFFRPPADQNQELLKKLTKLNIGAVLLGTIGGFGSLFALLISPQLRGYNRISVYIAFFSLFAVLILMEKIHGQLVKAKWQRQVFYGLLGLLLVLGLLDQIPKNVVPDYNLLKTEDGKTAKYIAEIENQLPKKAMIFQLPYVAFPEPERKNFDYNLFGVGYLHSQSLRWSYGAIKGREGDLWQRMVVSVPMEEFVQAISFAGFSGILLDRFGYPDTKVEMEQRLTNILNTKPLIDANSRLVFFNMAEFNQKLKDQYTPQEWELRRYAVLHPLIISWQGGFSVVEGTPDMNWRWSAAEGELHLLNPSESKRKVTVEMTIRSGYQEYSNLEITSPLFTKKLQINDQGTYFQQTLILPPGKHVLKFVSDAKQVYAPDDPRVLVFKVINARVFEGK